MCDGVGLTSGLGMLSAGVKTSQQMAAQRASYEHDMQQNQIARMQADYESTVRGNAAVLQFEALRNRDIEVTEAATQEKGEIASQADKRRALQQVAASYNGASSAMLSRLESEISGDEAEAIASVEANKQAELRNDESNRQAVYMNAQPAPTYLTAVEEPNYGMTLLSGILSGAAGAKKTTNRYQ